AQNVIARPQAAGPSRSVTGPADLNAWRAAIEGVRAKSPRHARSLAFGRLIRIGAGEVVLAFSKDADFHRTTVAGNGRALVEEVLTQQFGTPTRLVVDQNAADSAPLSIAEEEARDRAAHERNVESRVRHHEVTQSVLRILGGELEHIQVLERERPGVPDTDPADENA
ncbi:MAG: DNA polymerase III subunit gamma/tau, partial [Myxococcaceae bacterium]